MSSVKRIFAIEQLSDIQLNALKLLSIRTGGRYVTKRIQDYLKQLICNFIGKL